MIPRVLARGRGLEVSGSEVSRLKGNSGNKVVCSCSVLHCPGPSTLRLCGGTSTVPGRCTVRGEEEKGRGQEGRREEGGGEEWSRRVEEGTTAT